MQWGTGITSSSLVCQFQSIDNTFTVVTIALIEEVVDL